MRSRHEPRAARELDRGLSGSVSSYGSVLIA
jgi:hypothetical protein